ncbi:hypothetical protein BDN67DRAFT_1016178 [Paxillus ammoniavirescens]|nr:hypothetical protein BDN67DRAFT_1016178 [Paxillus ammoniavirescens]
MSQLKHLTGESALTFLLTHDAEHLGLHVPLASKQDGAHAAFAADDVVTDKPAFVTVKTTRKRPLAQDIKVEVPALNFVFTHSGPFQWPDKCTKVASNAGLTAYSPDSAPHCGLPERQRHDLPQRPEPPGRRIRVQCPAIPIVRL